jgi:hypothetical protein
VAAILALFGTSAGGTEAVGSLVGRAPAETVIFLAPPVLEIPIDILPSKPLRLEIRGGDVTPRISWAPVRTRLLLESKDALFSDMAVYSGISDLLFRSKFVLLGDRHEGVLERPGLVTLENEVRPLRHAYVYVTPTGVGAVADASGRYALSGVIPGRRRFTAWNETRGVADRWIEVAKGKPAVWDVEFPPR